MSEKTPTSFEERLGRIAADKPTVQAQTPRDPMRKDRKRGFSAKILIIPMVAAAVVIGSVAYAAHWLTSTDLPLRKMARDAMINMLPAATSTTGYDGLIHSGPKEMEMGYVGWEYPATHVALKEHRDLKVDTLVVPNTKDDSSPKSVRFEPNSACTLRAPQPDQVVHNVRLMDASRYTKLHLFSKTELAEAVIDRIAGMRSSKANYKNAAIAEGRMGTVDVYVTDTSAPVYLVLGVLDKDVLWNIHLAPGAQLGHVALIGNKSAFSAPAGDYTYEALRIHDFLDEDAIYDNEEPQPCMVAPWREPQSWWTTAERLNHPIDAGHYQHIWNTNVQGYAAFDTWYRAQTGTAANVNAVEAIKAAHALVGPLPQSPIALSKNSTRVIHLASSDYMATSEAQIVAIHEELLLAAVGGDLLALTPPPMDRSELEMEQ